MSYPHLLIDESGYPLDAAPPGQPPDGGLGDALDVVPQHLPMSLGSPLTQPLSSLPASMSVSTHSILIFSLDRLHNTLPAVAVKSQNFTCIFDNILNNVLTILSSLLL